MLSASENLAPTSTAIPLTSPNRLSFRRWSGLEDALEFEYGYSSYINVQTITVQEMPERAPFGQVVRMLRF